MEKRSEGLKKNFKLVYELEAEDISEILLLANKFLMDTFHSYGTEIIAIKQCQKGETANGELNELFCHTGKNALGK